MHQFPAWRYWLVVAVLLLGLLLALPNVFGEDDAVQLARRDRAAMDAAQETLVTEQLRGAGLAPKGSYFEGGRLVLRFADAETQAKARDTLSGGDYVAALARVSRAPDWMRAVGLRPMNLGLDLRGGVHFLYEVDVAAAVAQTLKRLERDVRTVLRDKRLPYETVANEGGKLTVTLRSADQLSAAVDAVGKIETGLIVSPVSGAPAFTVALSDVSMQERQTTAIEQNITTLRNRVDQLGVSEPFVARQGRDRILVQLPGVQDPNEAKRVLGSTATLQWHMVDQQNDAREADRTKRIPLGSKLYKMREDGSPILLKRELIVTGDQMTDARADFVQGEPAVSVKLDARGGDRMLKNTQQNLGKLMAVLFIEKRRLAPGERCDGVRVGSECTQEEVISAATIRGVFGPQFQITGLMAGEARELALLLRAGSLATPIYPVEERTVGPSLGADNIKNGFYAMVIGMLATFTFMIFYYRWFGVVACAVLTANVVLLVAAMSFLGTTFGAALSLPGIAGIVLTVGMAADANVLIYERIREELRIGNSPQAAIHAGFDKAFTAIADSNITTLIAGVALFAIGSGPIKGFAVTLIIGIATSLFTAILGSRALIQVVWGNRRQLQALPV
jgi:preprotein translocase subunit SecD